MPWLDPFVFVNQPRLAVALGGPVFGRGRNVIVQRIESPLAAFTQRMLSRARVKSLIDRLGHDDWMSRWDYVTRGYDARPANLAPALWLTVDIDPAAAAIAQSVAESRGFRRLVSFIGPDFTLFDLFALFARVFKSKLKPRPLRAPRMLLKKASVALRCAFVTLVGFFGAGKVSARNNP